ncbi:hypothetical protein [Streptomyces gobiensis]|uniref:hypothetical protein n=1 Tax=Streptomyces gobiensis TaxID=2875706 RepID=UPI001E3B037A|nr:hypothetical protein [Streptomyces gobiensis]UGY93373.1 hypothetical protein test1122_17740 [Streptomyces gobiensis]
MGVDRYLQTIDELCLLPFGLSWEEDEPWRVSGDDFYMVPLRISDSFSYPNNDPAVYRAVSAEFERELEEIGRALDSRWGVHELVPMFGFYELYVDQEPIPRLFQHLCNFGFFGDLLVWRREGRWVGLSVGHEDKEQPLVLFAVVSGLSDGLPG